MSVTLHGSDGEGLFDRIGSIGGGLQDLWALLGAAVTDRVLSGANWVTRANTLDAYYGATPANRKVLDGLFQSLAGWQQGQTGFASALRQIAQNTVIDMVNTDSPLASKTLAVALEILIRQMTASSDSVNASSVAAGSQTAVGTVTGTPAIVMSLKRPSGLNAEYAIPETFRFACSSDTGLGATAYREPFLVTSPAVASDPLGYDWPLGSGVSRSLTCVDPSQDASSNLLTNSDFESFTSNTPDKWSVLSGAAGTDILAAGSGDAYASSTNALRYAYDAGAPTSSIAQTFGSSDGTTATLKPNTVYLFNCWMKKTSGLSGNGTIAFELVDGSNAIVADDAGNNNQVTQTAAGLTTSYTKVSGAFVTPKVLPSTIKFRLRLTVAIADASKSVYVDHLAMCEGTELYTGGPYAAIFAGDTKPVKGDTWTRAVTNTWGEFQKLFQRLFDMRSLGLQLPSNASSSETIPDSYIA